MGFGLEVEVRGQDIGEGGVGEGGVGTIVDDLEGIGACAE
jgi:hypothetical protein